MRGQQRLIIRRVQRRGGQNQRVFAGIAVIATPPAHQVKLILLVQGYGPVIADPHFQRSHLRPLNLAVFQQVQQQLLKLNQQEHKMDLQRQQPLKAQVQLGNLKLLQMMNLLTKLRLLYYMLLRNKYH